MVAYVPLRTTLVGWTGNIVAGLQALLLYPLRVLIRRSPAYQSRRVRKNVPAYAAIWKMTHGVVIAFAAAGPE